jgi:citrate lyase alpha subunit
VFFGRWLPGLRVIVAWLAGADRLAWRRFLLWNALGGVTWAASIASAAYALGRSASGYLALIGLGGIALAAAVIAARRLRRPLALARVALHGVARGLVDVAAFGLVAIVVAVIEVNELRREAANALARPKGHV